VVPRELGELIKRMTKPLQSGCEFALKLSRAQQVTAQNTIHLLEPNVAELQLVTDLHTGKDVPPQPTGWEKASGATVTFTAPYGWTAGRIRGRIECNFAVNPGPNRRL